MNIWAFFGWGLCCGVIGYFAGRLHQWVRDADHYYNGRSPS